jgi:hypothetical protein
MRHRIQRELTVETVSVVLPQTSGVSKCRILGIVQPWNSLLRSCLQTASVSAHQSPPHSHRYTRDDLRLDIKFSPVKTIGNNPRGYLTNIGEYEQDDSDGC